jgi:hypothetical protein
MGSRAVAVVLPGALIAAGACSSGALVDGGPPAATMLADDASASVDTEAESAVDAEAENGFAVGADAAFEDAERTDSPSSASADARAPAQCQWGQGDATAVTVAYTGSELEAGPYDAIILWVDDAGVGGSCGPGSCDGRCPPGAACRAAYITHALVHAGGTCP